MSLRIFKSSPATSVVVFVGGVARPSGRGGKLVLVGPRTSVAVIPAGDVPVNFLFTERTRDDQEVVVQGDLIVRLDADKVVKRRNFVVDPRTRRYEDPNELEALHNDFRRLFQGLVREQVRARTLRDNIADVAGIEAAVRASAANLAAAAVELGGRIAAIFVRGVSPGNAKLKEALEAEERERMLSKADAALHERREENAKRERSLKLYEAETAVRVEAENFKLAEQQALNLAKTAEGDAEATRIKLEPFRGMPPGLVLAHAILEMARSGRVESFHLSPDVVSAIQAAARE